MVLLEGRWVHAMIMYDDMSLSKDYAAVVAKVTNLPRGERD